MSANKARAILSVEDYERQAQHLLEPSVLEYISGTTESGSTHARNLSAFSKYLIRRRVLKGIQKVETGVSYFSGKVKSELPFFPSCINVTPMYPKALLDIFRISKNFEVPIFISDLAITDTLKIDELPKLVPKTSPLIWQMYVLNNNFDLTLKKTRLAKEWGYSAVAVTVDAERGLKLGYQMKNPIILDEFRSMIPSDIRKIRNVSKIPLIVKGVMTHEDAEVVIENGADGVVVSNHGGRSMDSGEASIDVLPKIAKHLKSKKSTRRAEIFFDSGVRNGTDIIKVLALGARGCLIGRPYFWALAVDREKGIENVTRILREELVRTAALCGVSDLSKVDPKTVVMA